MCHYLYRKPAVLAITTLLSLVATGFAQSTSKTKKEKGPRALALLELPAGEKGSPRLIPLAILEKGRFWDATVYLADPRPFALDPGNVYEAERSGQPVGFFTVAEARQTGQRWVGLGEWQPNSAKNSGSGKVSRPDDDERPVLRKSQKSEPEPQAPAASQNRGGSEDRATRAPERASPPAEKDDPNRPVLRRGKPKTQAQADDVPEEKPKTSAAQASARPGAAPAQPAAAVKPAEVLPAISDAAGPEPRSFAYEWAKGEQQKLSKAASDMAAAELARYAKSNPALQFTPAANFDQVSVRAFDLHGDNYAVVVYTARVPAAVATNPRSRTAKAPQPAPDFWFYVTVVGKADLYGELRKLFSAVTDSRHLDAFPRLELLDAVDAEGIGRGDLLFRAYSGAAQTSNTGLSGTPTYQLYHVGPDSLRKLFDSAG
jgi:hypothetical protein